MVTLALLAVLAAEGDWKRVDTIDGVTVDVRPVKDSHTVELQLITTVLSSPERLCESAFGRGRFDPTEKALKARTLLEESADEHLTYDQIQTPVVSNRDYVARVRRERLEAGACRVTFEAVNDRPQPLPPGFVRIEKLKGAWLFEPLDEGKTKITYRIHTDPAGAVPAFLVEGSRREMALYWLRRVVAGAQQKKQAPPSGPADR